MSEYKRQIFVGGVVAFVLGILVIAGAIYLPLAVTGTSSSTNQQTTTSLETT